jgi:hypothetical protein
LLRVQGGRVGGIEVRHWRGHLKDSGFVFLGQVMRPFGSQQPNSLDVCLFKNVSDAGIVGPLSVLCNQTPSRVDGLSAQ